MLCLHGKIETRWVRQTVPKKPDFNCTLSADRNPCGKYNVGLVFAHTRVVHITQYMGTSEAKEFGGIEAGHDPIVQQYYGIVGAKGIFSFASRKSTGFYLRRKKRLLISMHSFQAILLKGMCRTTVTLKPISLKAILSLSVRPLISSHFSENLMIMFLVQILSIPALIYQIETLVPECIQTLQSHAILQRTLEILEKEQSVKIIINSMKGTQSLAVLANVNQLFYLEPIESVQELGFPTFTVSWGLSTFWRQCD